MVCGTWRLLAQADLERGFPSYPYRSGDRCPLLGTRGRIDGRFTEPARESRTSAPAGSLRELRQVVDPYERPD